MVEPGSFLVGLVKLAICSGSKPVEVRLDVRDFATAKAQAHVRGWQVTGPREDADGWEHFVVRDAPSVLRPGVSIPVAKSEPVHRESAIVLGGGLVTVRPVFR